MIYDTVECSIEGRAAVDWESAEKLVNSNFQWLIGRAVGCPIEGDIYCGDNLSLPNEMSFEDFEVSWGRVIWENFRGLRSKLPRPPYGRIVFS
jgi:hypothetical protein